MLTQEGGIEAHTKLANEIIHFSLVSGTVTHLLQELAGARLGNSTKVVDEIFLGHANTSVSDVQHVPIFVCL